MQYALIAGLKCEPYKGAEGVCISCGHKMIARCGDIRLHHWAHAAAARCDSWWEAETEWHREWKNSFPESYREISFFDAAQQEYHRADVHTPAGVTVEFQNSPLSLQELLSREAFYPKLVWVVNGKKFSGFALAKNIPDPASAALSAYVFSGRSHLVLYRCAVPEAENKKAARLSLHHPELKHIPPSAQHYSFSWRHPHVAWYTASRPVFIDFGGHFLYWLRRREQPGTPYLYLQLVSKARFLAKYT